jgi:hypothetical protein
MSAETPPRPNEGLVQMDESGLYPTISVDDIVLRFAAGEHEDTPLSADSYVAEHEVSTAAMVVDYAVPSFSDRRTESAAMMCPATTTPVTELVAPEAPVETSSDTIVREATLPALDETHAVVAPNDDHKIVNGSNDGNDCLDSHNDTITREAEGAIWEPNPQDVLSGRGAQVNAHPGNKTFRAMCFARKALFDAANHAAKQRIATEIWTTCVSQYQARYLKRNDNQGPWFEQAFSDAVLKAAQVMRDYRRPDRLLAREASPATSKKRSRPSATPMDNIVILPPPVEPILENPLGARENDVLCGRGAVSLREAFECAAAC